METSRLIDLLAAEAAPVRRASPLAQAALWLGVALAYAALLVVLNAPRSDLAVQLGDPRFLVEALAALATAATAAFAAFVVTVPGRSARWGLLPLVPLAVWILAVGDACLREIGAAGPDALDLRIDWACLPALVEGVALPGLVVVLMLRRGLPVRPRLTLALGGLAVAAAANAGLQLFHVGDVSIMLLAWHLGSVAVVTVIAWVAGRGVLRWPPVRLGAGDAPR